MVLVNLETVRAFLIIFRFFLNIFQQGYSFQYWLLNMTVQFLLLKISPTFGLKITIWLFLFDSINCFFAIIVKTKNLIFLNQMTIIYRKNYSRGLLQDISVLSCLFVLLRGFFVKKLRCGKFLFANEISALSNAWNIQIT